MKTYLQGCKVPTVDVGGVEIPRLIMGIHPFDGVSYQNADRDDDNAIHFSDLQHIVDVLNYVVDQGVTVAQTDHMLPHLDRQHLVAIWKSMMQTNTEIGIVPFILVPIVLDGAPIDGNRVLATFDRNAFDASGHAYRNYLQTDPIVRYNTSDGANPIVSFEEVKPYTAEEFERMEIDYDAFENRIGFFDGFERLIADPGAEVDLLAPGGRFDLIQEYIDFLRGHFRAVATSVHHPGITIPLLERHGVAFDGYITPLNKPGVFMMPTPESALKAIRNCSKPVIAIKPMAGGRLLGREAFDYVLNDVGANACMFGLGRMQQVRETVAEAKMSLHSV